MKPLSSLALPCTVACLLFAPPPSLPAQTPPPAPPAKSRAFFETKESEVFRRYAQSLQHAIDAAQRLKTAPSMSERERLRRDKRLADERAKADRVLLHAIAGAKQYPDACNKSVLVAARRQGRTDLPDWKANDQVDFLQRHWKAVDARTAQTRANRGEFGIAGLRQEPSGHVAVIVAGPGAVKGDRRFYPNIAGGARNPVARSAGELTAGDAWNSRVRAQVQYFFP